MLIINTLANHFTYSIIQIVVSTILFTRSKYNNPCVWCVAHFLYFLVVSPHTTSITQSHYVLH